MAITWMLRSLSWRISRNLRAILPTGSESVQEQQCHDGGNDENRQQIIEPDRMFADGSFDLPVADGNDPEAGYDYYGI